MSTDPKSQLRRRGPKPRFTRDEIVEHALELLISDGRDALNLRRLAATLGVTPMALYRYFADKDELLDAVVAAVLAPSASVEATAEWDAQLQAAMRDLHAALHRVPAVAEIVALRRPGAQLDPLRERLFGIVATAGLSGAQAEDTLRALTSFALGFALVTSPEERQAGYAASGASFEFGLELVMRSVRELAVA